MSSIRCTAGLAANEGYLEVNSFESGARKAIPAVLIYVKKSGSVLMLHRGGAGRENDYHLGKWNGLGGKCEPDESFLETARRELEEESGLNLPPEKFRPLGTLQFPNFKAKKNEDWFVTVFTAEITAELAQAVLPAGTEGTLHWIPESDLLTLNLWAGDREFLPHVISEKPFIGTIWYDGEVVRRKWIAPLGSESGWGSS